MLMPDHKTCRKCSEDKPLVAFREKARGLYGRSSWCLACERAYNRAYSSGPKREALLARRRQSWSESPQTAEQKHASAARAREWYQNNKTRRRETTRRWIQNNRDVFQRIQKKYLAKNPVYVRRRAHMAQVERTLTEAQWFETLECFDHRCAYCLRQTKLTMDHLIAVSRGGPHIADNVVPACQPCNSKKSSRPLWVMLNM